MGEHIGTRPGRFLLALLSVAALAVSGCTAYMALEKGGGTLQLDKESIALFTLRTANAYHPGFQPKVLWVEITAPGAEEGTRYGAADPYLEERFKFQEYLVSIPLRPGQYSIGDVKGTGRAPGGWLAGQFRFPIDADFTIPPNRVVYLGHVDMTNRQKNEGEPRSGSFFPLIDQKAAGFSDGTFDVAISDRYDEDVQAFRDHYPALDGQEIGRAELTPRIASF